MPYVLVEGCRWRSLPGDFPAAVPLIATGARTAPDQYSRPPREWTRIEQDRHPSPSESIIDSQSVKSAAGVSQQVGFDSGKLIKGRKRFLSVDIRSGASVRHLPVFQRGRQTSPQTGQTHGQITLPLNHYLGRRRLWWRTLPDVGDGRLPLIVQVVLRPNKPRASCCSKNGGWSSAPSVG